MPERERDPVEVPKLGMGAHSEEEEGCPCQEDPPHRSSSHGAPWKSWLNQMWSLLSCGPIYIQIKEVFQIEKLLPFSHF